MPSISELDVRAHLFEAHQCGVYAAEVLSLCVFPELDVFLRPCVLPENG